jgi:hypothetical protein
MPAFLAQTLLQPPLRFHDLRRAVEPFLGPAVLVDYDEAAANIPVPPPHFERVAAFDVQPRSRHATSIERSLKSMVELVQRDVGGAPFPVAWNARFTASATVASNETTDASFVRKIIRSSVGLGSSMRVKNNTSRRIPTVSIVMNPIVGMRWGVCGL